MTKRVQYSINKNTLISKSQLRRLDQQIQPSPVIVSPETPRTYLAQIFERLTNIEKLLLRMNSTLEVMNNRERIKINDYV